MVVMISSEEYRDLVIKANKYDELIKKDTSDNSDISVEITSNLCECLKNMKKDNKRHDTKKKGDETNDN